jgi:hypothetical protein
MQVMQQSEKRNEALQIVACLFRIHLDYVEPIKVHIILHFCPCHPTHFPPACGSQPL